MLALNKYYYLDSFYGEPRVE